LVYLTVFAPGGMPYFNKKFNLNSYTMLIVKIIYTAFMVWLICLFLPSWKASGKI